MFRPDYGVGGSPYEAEYFEVMPPSTLFDFGGGGDMSGAYERAGAMQAAAADRAAQYQQEMFQQARTDLAPWRTSGTTAETQIGSMLGLSGYPTVDPSAVLAQTPGYQWAQQQGVQALDRSAASRGMILSGPQQKALTNYGQNLAMTYAYNPYMQNLQAMSGRGAGAAGQSGNWAMQTGQLVGQDWMSGANAQAQAAVQAAQAQQQANQGMWSNIMMGAGMLGIGPYGGMAMGPLQGLFGAGSGSSALSGLMGGGGGMSGLSGPAAQAAFSGGGASFGGGAGGLFGGSNVAGAALLL